MSPKLLLIFVQRGVVSSGCPPRACSLTGNVCEMVHVHTQENKNAQNLLQVLVLLFLVVVAQPCKWLCWGYSRSPLGQLCGWWQFTALAPTSSLHFRWLVKELLPWAVWDTVPAELQPHVLQLPMQMSQETGKKDRPSILFKTFKKLIDKNW